ETRNYLRGYREKVFLTGNPLRQKLEKLEKERAISFLGLSSQKFTFLVMGGSQASRAINRIFMEAIKDFEFKEKIQVVHLCGKEDKYALENFYRELNLEAKVFSFFAQMQYLYSVADLAISRAGATTIAELIEFRLPAVLIPYPYADGHQLLNARVLEDIGSAVVIPEDELSSQRLKERLRQFIASPELIKRMSLNYERFKNLNPQDRLKDLVLSLL
ncbi:MAG: undecaprenyldiphospho-muramoylpentapeptide beta-N-acetylglucosaminyltransferase, partial [Candidatus Omnitrophica bacterium]|nr:undecaprenyldiphospho-muramoylpentapeptide beta-N-acetylglucosaminyltransferase [Candidatus Omnitrophota bacterium]